MSRAFTLTKADLTATTNKKQLTFKYAKVHKDEVVAESKEKDGSVKSILIQLDAEHFVWISTKYVFESKYTNFLSLSLVNEWEYTVYIQDDEGKMKEDSKVSAETIRYMLSK